jgi:hypothetical protein
LESVRRSKTQHDLKAKRKVVLHLPPSKPHTIKDTLEEADRGGEGEAGDCGGLTLKKTPQRMFQQVYKTDKKEGKREMNKYL